MLGWRIKYITKHGGKYRRLLHLRQVMEDLTYPVEKLRPDTGRLEISQSNQAKKKSLGELKNIGFHPAVLQNWNVQG